MSARKPGEPAALHTRMHDAFAAQAAHQESIANRYSLVRLLSFVAAAVCFTTGIVEHASWAFALAAVLTIGFVIAVVLHARTISAQDGALTRKAIHARHLLRLGSGWTKLPSQGADLLSRDHAYAWDIDLLGPSSLFQRIDVSHTRDGERTLAAWLGRAAEHDAIVERQVAVAELAEALELRQELEAAASSELEHKLDPQGVELLAHLPALFEQRPWLRAVVFVLPLCTLLVYVGGLLGLWPAALWLLLAGGQALLLARFAAEVRRALDVVSAKLPVLESFERMLLVLERAQWNAPLLLALQKRVAFGDVPPSAHMRRLARWASFAELRQNFSFYVPINTLTLWDLHVLWGVERFVREVGSRTSEWFRALAELEALSSLATLAHGDPHAMFPAVVAGKEAFVARGLGHPLLLPQARVDNDLGLRGPGTALVVTGSNMAGKSTLLRAVGQNIVLALAGGPVIARECSVPAVRLRASMRAEDSLASGASYFHAELQKLRLVIEDADAEPPVFFLLDELLRGTNARARHVGAKAVLLHLLDRGGMGLVATHDVELAALGNEPNARIDNVHFTDVVIDGEMRFDYKLRTGIVQTSNALRLLAMAGIDVPEHERIALEGPDVGVKISSPKPAAAGPARVKEAL